MVPILTRRFSNPLEMPTSKSLIDKLSKRHSKFVSHLRFLMSINVSIKLMIIIIQVMTKNEIV